MSILRPLSAAQANPAPAEVGAGPTRAIQENNARQSARFDDSSPALFVTSVMLTVGWGVLAFGAVYPWAYTPLLLAGTIVGLWGLAGSSPAGRRRIHLPLALALALLLIAISLQLVPLPREWLLAISPAADAFLLDYDIPYSAAFASGQPVAHPLTINPRQTRLGLGFAAALSIFLIGQTRALDGYRLRRLMPALVCLGAVVAAIGIVQRPFFTGRIYGFWVPQAGEIGFGAAGGPFGPFVNRNHFAGWMLMMVPLSLGYLGALVARGMPGVKPGWRQRLLWFSTPAANRALLVAFAVVLMALSLVLTLSRSGITCLVIALVFAAAAALRRHRGWIQRGIIAVVVIAASAIGANWTGTDAIVARFGDVDRGLADRVAAWQDAWRVVEAFPMTGSGLNTYGTAMLQYQTFLRDRVHFAEAHADYLQLLAEGGVLLAVAAAICALVFAIAVVRRFRGGGDDAFGFWIRFGAVTGVVAVGLQELVEFSLQMPGNAVLFALLCAIAVREPTLNRRSTADSLHS